jgi:hypothetical protein
VFIAIDLADKPTDAQGRFAFNREFKDSLTIEVTRRGRILSSNAFSS